MNWVKDKLGLGKKAADATLANADNGRFLVEISAKEYVGNTNIRDINERVEINLEFGEEEEDEDDDNSPLLDGDFVLVKFRRGLKFLACVAEHEDVPGNTVRIDSVGMKNLACGANDLVSVSPYPPEAKEGQPKETLENAHTVVFQVRRFYLIFFFLLPFLPFLLLVLLSLPQHSLHSIFFFASFSDTFFFYFVVLFP